MLGIITVYRSSSLDFELRKLGNLGVVLLVSLFLVHIILYYHRILYSELLKFQTWPNSTRLKAANFHFTCTISAVLVEIQCFHRILGWIYQCTRQCQCLCDYLFLLFFDLFFEISNILEKFCLLMLGLLLKLGNFYRKLWFLIYL